MILLIGIVKKNGIMMVDVRSGRSREGLAPQEQRSATRALLALPADHDDDDGGAAGRRAAMLGTGAGSELRRPLGYAMVGGLLVSQALTLFTTPVIYLYLDRLSDAFRGWGRSAPMTKRRAGDEHGSVKQAAE